jgi:hypothetical protein
VNVAIGDPSDRHQVVNIVIGDNLLQLFTKQSNLYHKENVEKWKCSHKSLKWITINTAEINFFRTDTSDKPSLK